MGIPDSTLPDLIEKVRSWISWRAKDLASSSGGFEMASNDCRTCCECGLNFTESCLKYHCQSCARVSCGNCVQGNGSFDVVSSGDLKSTKEAVINIKSCHFCAGLSTRQKDAKKSCDKIHPSDSPRQSPEPPSPTLCNEKLDGYSSHAITKSSITSFSSFPSSVSLRCSPSRSDEDEEEDSTNHFCSLSSEYYHDTSDIESSSVSARHEFYSFQSVGSSPSDSPSRIHITSSRVGHPVQLEQRGNPRSQSDGPFVQETMAVLKGPGKGTEITYTVDDGDLTLFGDQYEKSQESLDFENNGLIWFPPPPDFEDDETENSFFTYEDEDDEIGDSGTTFSSSDSLANEFPMKERHNVDQKEPLRAVLHGHFRALVSQLLQGEGINLNKDNSSEDWVDIITALAWQAANYVKPDTSKGGSMDPCNYVKVKCLASGSPSESTLIKGVVCTKNIKHKRMISQYKNARLLLLGGALEYQRLPNQLSSLDTVLQQETDHMKLIVSKIEAHHPNVLLVEKSVSSRAQEYLLAKEISLVLNVKRPLLERIARCTGSLITPSVDHISSTRVGHCELFRLDRVSEEHEPVNQFNKKPSKTLMFFEGCPRRLGCTVLLKGSCRQELKKLKHVIQYAVFAAYHLSLETSFLADEGASLPRMQLKPSIAIPEKITADHTISLIPNSDVPDSCEEAIDALDINIRSSDLNLDTGFNLDTGLQDTLFKYHSDASMSEESKLRVVSSDACNENLASIDENELRHSLHTRVTNAMQGSMEATRQEEKQPGNLSELGKVERGNETEASNEYYSATDGQQSILVSFSSRCVLSGTVCERSRLLRIKFYGCFDKPLGRYLQDDLFDQTSCCQSCKEPTEAHVICYTHEQGNLTINVKRLPSVKLPGERDGKIWMWHRCLRCTPTGGVPPATRRVVMSDAAWGLSFGKFLELSFSNHATANRIASCGHSLQRDCLRFYGYGSMVAFFRYSPIDILSVRLPPSLLEFNGVAGQDWIRKEAVELLRKVETLYAEMSNILYSVEQKCSSFGHAISDTSELYNNIMELKDLLIRERNKYNDLLRPANDRSFEPGLATVDILELNRVRHSLLIGSHIWDRRLYSLDSLLEKTASFKASDSAVSCVEMKDCSSDSCNESLEYVHEEILHEGSKLPTHPTNDLQSEEEEPNDLKDVENMLANSLSTSYEHGTAEGMYADGVNGVRVTSLERAPSAASVLSDKIDSAWTGAEQPLEKAQLHRSLLGEGSEAASCRQIDQIDNPSFRRIMSPARVYSFDSAVRLQERIRKGLPPSSLHLSTLRSFHASGDYRSMVRDPVSSMQRTYSQMSTHEAQKINLSSSSSTSFISSMSLLPEGARLMVPQSGKDDIVIAVYDNEPTSIISYALSSKDYEERIADKPNVPDGGYNESPVASNFSAWQSFGSVDLDYIPYGSYGSEDASNSSPHLRISFEDESSNAAGRVKFSVTCYFAKEFDALRRRCCPNGVDFLRSLSRCRRWSAQGGKSNVYFAKSFDERFIIKQVTKTELESFQEFARAYFKYMTETLSSGSPTCLAKVLGIYQVAVKNLKGGKETKMDLMVMENLFYKRNISRVYDLKGSVRSRYNSDTTGTDKVLLDMNLLETLRTKPIFLGSKAKRSLERAVWNDTSFLASVDVMDYSLLVGVDDERKELVLGIIDFMRQYTWDKHLETWVKASGILGGPKNASPTIVSPKQYKKRFRKAMTTYFLTVPDQWSS